MNKAKSQFKGARLLYFNSKGNDKQIEEIKQKSEKANQALGYCRAIFPKPPSNDELLEAMKEGWAGIENLIKTVSGYPEGDIETILKLWGRFEHYKKAREFIGNEVFNFLKYREREYIFKDGTFSLNKHIIEEIRELHTYHTTNEKQNKAIDVMEKLSDGLNAAFDERIIYYDAAPKTLHTMTKNEVVRKISNFLTVKDDRVVPNLEMIRTIKE